MQIISSIILNIICSLALMFCTATAQQSCQTAQGDFGQCVAVKQCKYVLDLLAKYDNKLNNVPPEVLQHLQQSQCNNGEYTCCEKNQIISDTHNVDAIIAKTSTSDTDDFASYKASLNAAGVSVLKSLRCGLESTFKVKNGVEASLAEFPFMALLRYDSIDTPYQCGGTLITAQYVLSAAHCIEKNDVIGIRLGEHDLSTMKDCRHRRKGPFCIGPAEDYGIEKITKHPEYNEKTVVNDVALIKMDRIVEFKQHIKPICLPITESCFNPPDEFLIAGWGTTVLGNSSSVLLKANVDNQEIKTCKNIFRTATIDERHICAGNSNNIVDSCRGDSGGPLFYQVLYEKTPRYVQYGIVSFGVPQCDSKETYPSVYANIKHFMPWITSNIY